MAEAECHNPLLYRLVDTYGTQLIYPVDVAKCYWLNNNLPPSQIFDSGNNKGLDCQTSENLY